MYHWSWLIECDARDVAIMRIAKLWIGTGEQNAEFTFNSIHLWIRIRDVNESSLRFLSQSWTWTTGTSTHAHINAIGYRSNHYWLSYKTSSNIKRSSIITIATKKEQIRNDVIWSRGCFFVVIAQFQQASSGLAQYIVIFAERKPAHHKQTLNKRNTAKKPKHSSRDTHEPNGYRARSLAMGLFSSQ